MTLIQYFTSQFSVLQILDFFTRIAVACICGTCIGFERTKRFKDAGIRTHLVVCCASALMMIVSKYGFADLNNLFGEFYNGTKGADPSRIASQVVSGISFLGAGVIFKNGNNVKGLTTAAGLWATAGIGLAVGAGMYPLGIFVTILVCLLQWLMHRFPIGADSHANVRFCFTVRGDENFREEFQAVAAQNKIRILAISVEKEEDGDVAYDVQLLFPKNLAPEYFQQFLDSYGDRIPQYKMFPIT